jgi:hypothetical protein
MTEENRFKIVDQELYYNNKLVIGHDSISHVPCCHDDTVKTPIYDVLDHLFITIATDNEIGYDMIYVFPSTEEQILLLQFLILHQKGRL